MFFDHVAKRQRQKTPKPQASNQPAIHVHIPERLVSSETRAPLSDHQFPASSFQVIDLTGGDDSDDDFIAYPSTLEFLTRLHAVRPLCNYLQYHDKLVQHGIIYVDSVLNSQLDPTFFSDIIGIPAPEVCAFLGYAKKVARRAEKGKTHSGRANVKKEDFGECMTEYYYVSPSARALWFLLEVKPHGRIYASEWRREQRVCCTRCTTTLFFIPRCCSSRSRVLSFSWAISSLLKSYCEPGWPNKLRNGAYAQFTATAALQRPLTGSPL
jgi:hypothetical protein